MTIVMTGAGGALGTVVSERLSEAGHAVAGFERGDDWPSFLAAVEERLGPPSGAVLVAGGWQGGRALHDGGGAEYERMIESNLTTVQRALAALLPGMVARRAGSIVVIGSRPAAIPASSAGAAAYAASKAGAVALAQAAAAEVLEHGVRINAVLPSIIDTPTNRQYMGDGTADKWVTPDSLTAVIEFLLSASARDISGAAVPVYGRV